MPIIEIIIKYMSGKKNADADGLSRRQEGNTRECTVFPDVIKAVAMSVTATECPFIDSVYVSEASDSTPPSTEDISERLLQTHGLTAKDWRKAQLQDLSLSFVIKCLEAGLPRYAQAFPTRNETIARVLFHNYIVNYGFPARIHCDQGANFKSNLIKELCKITEVEKSRTTPYHPMGNGQVERFNQTLLQMLGTLQEKQKSDWKAHVPTLVYA